MKKQKKPRKIYKTHKMLMSCENPEHDKKNYNRPGFVLLITLVLLVVLSTFGYTLATRLSARRHRNQYIIDYQIARYGCDSALKYALATLEDINSPVLIARPNEPDFSELFAMSQTEYEKFISDWTIENSRSTSRSPLDTNDANTISTPNIFAAAASPNDANTIVVRGPYGPPWPLVTEPAEFEIGSAKVTIEIEDENAKYPIGWALLGDKNAEREAQASLETFCEWMDVNNVTVRELTLQLEKLKEIKEFKLDFKPVKKREETKAETKTSKRGRRRRRVRRRRRSKRKTVTIPASIHTADFAKLFNSSLIDTETLSRPTIINEDRKESALKYMAIWASSRVNINTAPRHVLEAAFTFGGDADKIAKEIIQRRRIEPFKDIDDLKKELFRYTDSIEKSQKYITTASSFYTIRVTATSGVAEASAVIVIKKSGNKLEKIAIVSS